MIERGCRTRVLAIAIGVLLVGVFLVGAQAAFAVDAGGTVEGEGLCMQRIFIGNTTDSVTGSNRLNCTANDISVAKALSATCSGSGCVSTTECAEGEFFTANATFQVNVTANARYDAGIFFRTDGGSSARGDGTSATGHCSLSWFELPAPTGSPALNLDGDTCGDLNAGSYTTISFTIPNVKCVESTTKPGNVSLPNCTSWHSNQGTACTAPLTSASDNNKFNFHPDTKSKCACDDQFFIPIAVRKPGGTVTKSATQADVTFSITVTNTSALNVQVTKLTDNKATGGTPAGDITSVHNDVIKACTDSSNAVVTLPKALSPTGQTGDSFTCSYVLRVNDTGGDQTNTVTATLHRTIDGTSTTNDVDVTGSTTINVDLNK
jgi:hypothetical protein